MRDRRKSGIHSGCPVPGSHLGIQATSEGFCYDFGFPFRFPEENFPETEAVLLPLTALSARQVFFYHRDVDVHG